MDHEGWERKILLEEKWQNTGVSSGEETGSDEAEEESISSFLVGCH